MKLIWMSDLHFEAEGLVLGHDPRQRLQAAVGYIAAHHGDAAACLITGDLVETGTERNYRVLQGFLNELPMPVLPLTGNHDDRAALRQGLPLPESAMPGFVQYRADFGELAVLCLDTLIPGEGAGFLCDERLGWLKRQLDSLDGRPAVVAMHHPPMKLGLPMLDPDNLQNGSDILELLASYPNVLHLLAGHVHRPCSGSVGGIPFTTAKSVLYQAPPPRPAWDWDSFQPAAEAPALTVMEYGENGLTLQQCQFCDYALGAPAA
ncbi:3',5'-cyclic-nucleotide phosphodiesterase [Leisingera sp. ANG-M1]|uniref:phosphodiesterase n=1 Tax=Leisingera sp. ANG-M1 TaxID=1577895 RepID=UPI0005804AAC|nr:phosphodiesterase [Leisingera sp. ANG-M1]KIC09989.1 3',5'-cyclic-nucleotide phosphodiesterase [Leisingera sp. ANG-M1]